MTVAPRGVLTGQFYAFCAEIDFNAVTAYFNRRLVWRRATPPEFHRLMGILGNLALGDGWPIDKTPNLSSLEVDYICS